jgi:DNA-binding PucR family transcriptional regulator
VTIELTRPHALDELGRQLRELSFLQRISAQAAATRDHSAMLRLIVDETTEVMGAEVCSFYLLADDGRALVLSATNGISQEQIGHLRLGPGEGVTGWVALHREPLAVEDVACEPRFRFVPGVDDPYASMLSVPVIAADRVVGVINVQTRARRVFETHEVEFLRALAGQVAGLIEISHLHSQVAEQVARLNEVNARLVRASEIHTQFTRLVLADRGIEAIAQTLANLVGHPVVVEGAAFQLLAAVRPREDGGRWRRWRPEPLPRGLPGEGDVQCQIERAIRSHQPVELALPCGQAPRRTLLSVVAGRQHFGFVSVLHDGSLDTADARTALEQASTVLAMEFLKQKVAFEVEQRLRGDFLTLLLAAEGDDDLARVRSQAGYVGLDLTQPHVIALAEPLCAGPGGDLRRVQEVAGGELRDRSGGGMAVLRNDAVALLLPSTGIVPRLTGLQRSLEAALAGPVRIALGDPFADPRGARVSHRQARHVLDAMRRANRGGVASPSELGAYQLLLAVQDERQLAEFARRELGPLLDYDATHGAQLVDTLEALIRHNGSLKLAAAELYVHVNTLGYRLGRIKQLLGSGIDDADRRASLYLALLIVRMEQGRPRVHGA